MRDFLRRSFVWLVALAFIANGLAGRQCLAAQLPVGAQKRHLSHDDPSHHPHSTKLADGWHQIKHQHVFDDHGQQPATGHDCGKCSICTVSAVAQAVETGSLILSVSSVSFSNLSEPQEGRTIDPDPGIPKPLS